MELITLFISAVVINNIILTHFFGMCPFLGVSKKMSSAVGMGLAVTFVIFGSSLLTYGLYYLVLVPLQIEFMDLLTFILVIAAFVQFVEMFLKKNSPSLYKSLGIYLPLITTNCAILGTANSAIVFQSYNFVYSFCVSVATGVGFLFAICLLAGVRLKTDKADIPACFKGFPITLVTAAIMAMAFAGFSGILA